jgi:hypothetical protein
MTNETDDRKRSHLRLVVNNPEKRNPREDDVIGLEDLVARRDEIRPQFYRDMDRAHGKAYSVLERFLGGRGWPYGLDPHYGRPIVLPAAVVCPEALAHEVDPRDEVLIFVTEDATGRGLCLSLEMILPFYSDDESVMEDALLYSPLFQYGTMFLEENRQDGLLDLIYRLAFPLYPPALSSRILDRLFAVAAQEVADALQGFSEYPST